MLKAMFKEMAQTRQLLVSVFLLCSLLGCASQGPKERFHPEPEVQTEIEQAKYGDYSAQYSVGRRFATGDGVPQDLEKAREWFQQSASGGNVAAQYNLGYMSETGQGAPQNYAMAAKYYQMAASNGHTQAQYNLSLLYHQGKGVSKDNIMAYKWLLVASQSGNRRARMQMSVIRKEMSSEQIEYAKQLAEKAS